MPSPVLHVLLWKRKACLLLKLSASHAARISYLFLISVQLRLLIATDGSSSAQRGKNQRTGPAGGRSLTPIHLDGRATSNIPLGPWTGTHQSRGLPRFGSRQHPGQSKLSPRSLDSHFRDKAQERPGDTQLYPIWQEVACVLFADHCSGSSGKSVRSLPRAWPSGHYKPYTTYGGD